MRQFTIVAATVAIAALISGAPASADHIQGGPIKQNGQCWQKQKGSEAGTLGLLATVRRKGQQRRRTGHRPRGA